MIGIYKITSPTAKVYIGQTWNSVKRFNNYKNLHCRCQTKLYNSLKKYGSDKHVIEMIHVLPSDIDQKDLDRYEELYIEIYKDSFEMMNLRQPGSRGKHSLETREKMKGRKQVWNEARRNKVSNTLRRHFISNKPKTSIEIVQTCPTTGKRVIWESGVEAAKKLKISTKGISRAVNGKNKNNMYAGFIWNYN